MHCDEVKVQSDNDINHGSYAVSREVTRDALHRSALWRWRIWSAERQSSDWLGQRNYISNPQSDDKKRTMLVAPAHFVDIWQDGETEAR